jgi:hypothetical protein
VTLVANMYDWITYWEEKFKEAADALGYESEMVFYGDQDRLPGYPAVCLEPDETTYDVIYIGRKANISFSYYILIYHGEIQDPSLNRREADVLAASCADLVHSHMTGEGRVVNCQVDRITSGVAVKAGTTVRASRLSVSATSQKQLPQTP